MARVSRSFVADSLWPAFTELDRALHEHLDRITEDIITQGISRDTSEAEEIQGALEGDES